jgi:hypothetical protein
MSHHRCGWFLKRHHFFLLFWLLFVFNAVDAQSEGIDQSYLINVCTIIVLLIEAIYIVMLQQLLQHFHFVRR